MYFQLSQMEFWMYALFGGILMTILMVLGYYAWRVNLSVRQDRETLTGESEHQYGQGYKEENRPIPLLLILVIVIVLLWGAGYAILVAMGVFDVA